MSVGVGLGVSLGLFRSALGSEEICAVFVIFFSGVCSTGGGAWLVIVSGIHVGVLIVIYV